MTVLAKVIVTAAVSMLLVNAAFAQTGVTINANGDVNTTGKVLENGNALLPRYTVIMWAGSATQIPAGWALCDGGTYTAPDGSSVKTPNLKGKFIVGRDPADTDYDATDLVNAPDTGGEKKHTLTIAELAPHGHQMKVVTGNDDNNHNGNSTYWPAAQDVADSSPHSGQDTNLTGGGQSFENRPPYYALIFLMKL